MRRIYLEGEHGKGVVQEEMGGEVGSRGEKYDLSTVYAHMELPNNKYNLKIKKGVV